jgi:ParB/RepB/Spo0J family partition protein
MTTNIEIDGDASSPASEVAHLASSIELVPIESIQGYERNPREHSERQLAKLAETIRSVGFVVPIIVDAKGIIVAGHGRLMAARRLGLKRVPVIRVEHLTPAQVKAFRIADNRVSELGR